MLDVRRLRLLRELAHRGTIAAVAEALAFSPSAVSQQLSALEREAGVALLERTGRRVALTPAAHNLVRHAEAVLAHLEQAAAELAESRRGPAGPLRIGTFPSAARVVIPPALVLLAERCPELEPMVAEVDPAGVADLLRAGELDVALVHDYDFVPAPAESGIDSEPLFAEAMYLATTAPGPGTLAAHSDAPWILATHGTLCHAMAVRACQAAASPADPAPGRRLRHRARPGRGGPGRRPGPRTRPAGPAAHRPAAPPADVPAHRRHLPPRCGRPPRDHRLRLGGPRRAADRTAELTRVQVKERSKGWSTTGQAAVRVTVMIKLFSPPVSRV